ncbi:hypothetical protein Lokhon_00503 [Limimaricola hongkongensis DSM 17492]|uniref:Uncharacterized protein n=1 Tax=Limimaricola hongkongensis DSM 17492 TaxID=1122180 RepID=A0A017HFP9_9RHOB|nr:hypothetical protein Lokhon_00503 [Limimaricola hongkongensis DSM 17492]
MRPGVAGRHGRAAFAARRGRVALARKTHAGRAGGECWTSSCPRG